MNATGGFFDWLRRRARTPEERHALVGPPGLWRMKRDFQFAFLRARGLRPEHSLLDVGCGTLRGGIPLIDYLAPGNYAGVEVARHRLREGQSELRDSGLAHKRPQLVHARRLARLDLSRRFDWAWSFSVLIHMEDPVLRECLRFVARHLGPGGRFLANVGVGERPDRAWEEFPCVWRPPAFYAEAAGEAGLTLEDLGSAADHGHRTGIPDQDELRMLQFTPRR